jgi:hypothetical protein
VLPERPGRPGSLPGSSAKAGADARIRLSGGLARGPERDGYPNPPALRVRWMPESTPDFPDESPNPPARVGPRMRWMPESIATADGLATGAHGISLTQSQEKPYDDIQGPTLSPAGGDRSRR